jgi:asparagine synthase (glutamine-hydrolysing)
MADLVPPAIRERPKQPYRAPIARAFLAPNAPAYVADLLGAEAVRNAGYFNPTVVTGLVEKGRRAGRLSEHEAMAITGILSVQLLHHHFCAGAATLDEPRRWNGHRSTGEG